MSDDDFREKYPHLLFGVCLADECDEVLSSSLASMSSSPLRSWKRCTLPSGADPFQVSLIFQLQEAGAAFGPTTISNSISMRCLACPGNPRIGTIDEMFLSPGIQSPSALARAP